MKFFVCFALLAIVGSGCSSPVSSSSAVAASSGTPVAQESGDDVVGQTIDELTRLRKSAYGGYGGASIQSPPCPRNYLFSCQPNLAPVPCSAPSYGSAGAYSSPVASYVSPVYTAPQRQQQLFSAAYVPQTYGYQF